MLTQGCSCNGDLMNAAASKGYSSNQVRIGEFNLCASVCILFLTFSL